MDVRDAGDDLVIRPDSRMALGVLTAMLVAAVGIVALILVSDAPNVAAALVGAFFAMLIILGIGSFLRDRVVLTAQDLTIRVFLIQQRRPRTQIAEVVRATITYSSEGSNENLFFLDAQRKLVLRLGIDLYARKDLDRLIDALGVPCDTIDGQITPKKFTQKYPGLLWKIERHPYRIGIPVAVAICVAIFVAAIAFELIANV